MFKLFQKKNSKQQIQKKDPSQDDDCPMCHVSEDVIKSLKEEKPQEKQAGEKHSCCG